MMYFQPNREIRNTKQLPLGNLQKLVVHRWFFAAENLKTAHRNLDLFHQLPNICIYWHLLAHKDVEFANISIIPHSPHTLCAKQQL